MASYLGLCLTLATAYFLMGLSVAIQCYNCTGRYTNGHFDQGSSPYCGKAPEYIQAHLTPITCASGTCVVKRITDSKQVIVTRECGPTANQCMAESKYEDTRFENMGTQWCCQEDNCNINNGQSTPLAAKPLTIATFLIIYLVYRL